MSDKLSEDRKKESRSRQSETDRDGFGSPAGMEMTDVPPVASTPTTEEEPLVLQPQQAPSSSIPLTNEPATDSSETQPESEETPTKPRKRRLFFTPSRREPATSPQRGRGRGQERLPPLSPAITRYQGRAGVYSPAIPTETRQTSPSISVTPQPLPTRIRTNISQRTLEAGLSPPSQSVGIGSAATRSSGRRQRRTPPTRSELSGLSSATTPRSARRRGWNTPSKRRSFNPLGKISDIFSPQSPPSYSSMGVDDSNYPDIEQNSSFISESSEASSTTNSIKEPFAEQVERLDELLATPSQQLGPLAFTPHRDDVSDDDMDDEVEGLESSRRLLAEELSRVEFSLLGAVGAEKEGDSDEDRKPAASIGSKKQQEVFEGEKEEPDEDGISVEAPGLSKRQVRTSIKGEDDWVPLLMSDNKFPPNFSPLAEQQLYSHPNSNENRVDDTGNTQNVKSPPTRKMSKIIEKETQTEDRIPSDSDSSRKEVSSKSGESITSNIPIEADHYSIGDTTASSLPPPPPPLPPQIQTETTHEAISSPSIATEQETSHRPQKDSRAPEAQPSGIISKLDDTMLNVQYDSRIESPTNVSVASNDSKTGVVASSHGGIHTTNQSEGFRTRTYLDRNDSTAPENHPSVFESAESQLERSSLNSQSTFDPFSLSGSGDGRVSSLEMASSGTGSSRRNSNVETIPGREVLEKNDLLFRSFLSFAEQFEGREGDRTRINTKRGLEHSKQILMELNALFEIERNSPASTPAPVRDALPIASNTSLESARVGTVEDSMKGDSSGETFSTPPSIEEYPHQIIGGLSPISQSSGKIQQVRPYPGNENYIRSVERDGSSAEGSRMIAPSPPKLCNDGEVILVSSIHETPSMLDALISEEDEVIIFEKESPRAIKSDEVATNLRVERERAEETRKKTSPSQNHAMSTGRYSTKKMVQLSKCRMITLVIGVVMFIVGIILLMTSIFAGSFLPTSPTLNPTTTIPPSPSPTSTLSEAPTRADLIAFTVPYDIYVTDGKLSSVPQSLYIPDLIESLDLLTADILSNILQERMISGRLLTEVVLPTVVANVLDVPCPPDASRSSLCQQVTAKISLIDAEDTWRQFKDVTELAIEIGRLQFYLDRVNPESRAEVIDSVWRPPTEAPSNLPSILPSALTSLPSSTPTVQPSARPTIRSTFPSSSVPVSITSVPTSKPSNINMLPTVKPTGSSIDLSSSRPTFVPTRAQTVRPTFRYTRAPTNPPTFRPTIRSNPPTFRPTLRPTIDERAPPTFAPTRAPTNPPTFRPTLRPNIDETEPPTLVPTRVPTNLPTFRPIIAEIERPTFVPTRAPTDSPTSRPTLGPTIAEIKRPTVSPTRAPKDSPTFRPTQIQTNLPTMRPTKQESITFTPTRTRIDSPTSNPNQVQIGRPTVPPSRSQFSPSLAPIPSLSGDVPTIDPSSNTMESFSWEPSSTLLTTETPTDAPFFVHNKPFSIPISSQDSPSELPSEYTDEPSLRPSVGPSVEPSLRPTPLLNLLVQNSNDDGNALNDASSPQYRAYSWLRTNNFLPRYSPKRILQRYSLATFYFATEGDKWLENELWLSDAPECSWFFDTGSRRRCNIRGELVHLELDMNNLSGSIPAEIGLLSSGLQTMTLRGGGTGTLRGKLPSELGYLTLLQVFDVRNNDISGNIPPQIGSWRNIREIDVSRNRLRGNLPIEFGKLVNLTLLEVSENFMSGDLPTEIGQMSQCRELLFENNRFRSSIPTEIGNLVQLEKLRGGGNELKTIPTELGNLKAVVSVSLMNANIEGTIPTELGNLKVLRDLDLHGNELTGSIPSELANIFALDQLDLSNNKLRGQLPKELGFLIELRGLKLQHNLLTGTVPSELSEMRKLTSIYLNANDIGGTIPISVCETFNQTNPLFQTDCGDFEDNCPCCTICCEDDKCTCRYSGTPREFLCFQT